MIATGVSVGSSDAWSASGGLPGDNAPVASSIAATAGTSEQGDTVSFSEGAVRLAAATTGPGASLSLSVQVSHAAGAGQRDQVSLGLSIDGLAGKTPAPGAPSPFEDFTIFVGTGSGPAERFPVPLVMPHGPATGEDQQKSIDLALAAAMDDAKGGAFTISVWHDSTQPDVVGTDEYVSLSMDDKGKLTATSCQMTLVQHDNGFDFTKNIQTLSANAGAPKDVTATTGESRSVVRLKPDGSRFIASVDIDTTHRRKAATSRLSAPGAGFSTADVALASLVASQKARHASPRAGVPAFGAKVGGFSFTA